MIVTRYVVAACLSLCASPVGAVGMTGNDLLNNCRHESNDPKSMASTLYCVGYIEGVFDAFELNSITCPPNGVTNGQKVEIVLKVLKTHPEMTHKLAPTLMIDAASQAFPCHSKDP